MIMKHPPSFPYRRVLGVALMFLSLVFSQNVLAKPSLRAVGPYSELGENQFLVGVYTENRFQSANELIGSDEDKVLEVRFLVTKMYARRFRRLWQEGTAINASLEEFKLHSQSMVDFSELLQINLAKGDVLRIKRSLAGGVDVSLNSVLLGSLQDRYFFDLLLRAVVGPVPISNDLKERLTASTKQALELSNTFLSIRPGDKRRTAVLDALEKINDDKVARQAPELEKPIIAEQQDIKPKPESINVAKTTVPSKKSSVQKTASTQQKTEVKPKVIKKKKSSKPASILDQVAADNNSKTKKQQDDPVSSVDFNMLAEDERLVSEQVSEVNEIIAEKQAEKPRKLDGNKVSSVFSSSERIAYLIARKSYFSSVISRVSETVNKNKTDLSEENASQKKHIVRVTINVLNDGELKSVKLLNPSKNKRINDAAKLAIYDALPLPAFPETISDSALDMTIPVAIDDAYLYTLDTAGRI